MYVPPNTERPTIDQSLKLFQLTVAIRGGSNWKDHQGKPLTWTNDDINHVMENYAETADQIWDYLIKFSAPS